MGLHYKIRNLLVVIAVLVLFPLLGMNTAWGQEPFTVVNMTTPFGTSAYSAGIALEKVFQEAGSWVRWQVNPTPGAMYIVRYLHENQAKIESGELPPVITTTSAATLNHTQKGLPPFDKIPITYTGALFSSPAFINLWMTFDPTIKTAMDFVGKRAGFAEKARPFQSILSNKPYFDVLGIWDKVNWQYLGAINSKEALLNNRIDLHYGTFWGRVDQMPDGTFVCTQGAPSPPEMELLASGRKVHFVDFDPEIMRKGFDPEKDMIIHPVLIKKGAIEGIDRDVWAGVALGVFRAPQNLRPDVVQEIIRVRHKYREKLGQYHADLKFFPENPYPAGVPEAYIVPTVKQAMHNLGLPLPPGVR